MSEQVSIDKTEKSISSDNVKGTGVYNIEGERLGVIQTFVIRKRFGQVEYAVVSLEELLGIKGIHHLLPWDIFSYDEHLDRYSINLTKRELREAPSFSAGEMPWSDADYGRRVYEYYGLDYSFSH